MKSILKTGVIISLIAIILFLLFRSCKKKVEKEYISSGYKTDTIYLDKPYPIIKYRDSGKSNVIIPYKVIYYNAPTIHDTLYKDGITQYKFIDTGNITIKRDTGFFLPFRYHIGIDSFFVDSIDVRNTQVFTNAYNVNLAKYKYQYDGLFGLRIESKLKREYILKPHNIYTESNLYALYDPLHKNYMGKLDYSLMFKRVGIYGFVSGFNITPYYNIGLGIRIKLK